MAYIGFRPGTVRALSMLLLFQGGLCLTFAVLAAGIAVAVTLAQNTNGWQDLVQVTLLILAAAGAGCAALFLLAWNRLRRRHAATLGWSLAAELVPVIAFGATLGTRSPGSMLSLGLIAGLAVLGVYLARARSTRLWLTEDLDNH